MGGPVAPRRSIILAPRQFGGVDWQFDRPGTVGFAGLVPGNFEATTRIRSREDERNVIRR